MHFVIIGCGASGLKAATTIRKQDPKSDITLVSSDLWPFYLKPVLTDFIANQIDISRMANMSSTKIEEMNVEVISGKRVTSLEPEQNKIIFSDGSTFAYQFLLIATGAKAVMPAIGRDLMGSFRILNSLSDAVRIKNESLRSNNALVLGGGHYALEILRALHSLKFNLTLLTNKQIFWEKDHPISADKVAEKLEQAQIAVHYNADIVDVIDLDGESYRVITKDGSVFDTQLLIYTPFPEPNMDFVQGTSIETDKGIIVREDMRTSIPNVFACGDVAQFYDLNKGINRINFGWTSAAKQGEIAGLNMIGRDTVFISTKEEYFRQLYGAELLTRW